MEDPIQSVSIAHLYKHSAEIKSIRVECLWIFYFFRYLSIMQKVVIITRKSLWQTKQATNWNKRNAPQ